MAYYDINLDICCWIGMEWLNLLITGKNPTYAQAKINLFAHKTVYCVKAAFSCFCCLRVELENKEYHHGGFQQQSPQGLICRYKHMNRGHDRKILRLKVVPLAEFFVQ